MISGILPRALASVPLLFCYLSLHPEGDRRAQGSPRQGLILGRRAGTCLWNALIIKVIPTPKTHCPGGWEGQAVLSGSFLCGRTWIPLHTTSGEVIFGEMRERLWPQLCCKRRLCGSPHRDPGSTGVLTGRERSIWSLAAVRHLTFCPPVLTTERTRSEGLQVLWKRQELVKSE